MGLYGPNADCALQRTATRIQGTQVKLTLPGRSGALELRNQHLDRQAEKALQHRHLNV
jgi:hypothetical protein